MTDSVTWLGHAGTTIELDGVRLVTDPVLRSHVGPLRRRGPVPDERCWASPDAVLISHLHHDHLDLPSLRRLGRDTTLVVPSGAAPLLRSFTDVREVAVGASVTIGSVTVTAVPTNHPDDRVGTRVHAPAVGYLIRGRRERVWFAGDTGEFDAMRELRGEVDLALLPVGGWGPTLGPHHLDPRQAAGVAALVGARAAVPIHWGTLLVPGLWTLRPALTRTPGAEFARWAGQLAGDTEVSVLTAGSSLTIP